MAALWEEQVLMKFLNSIVGPQQDPAAQLDHKCSLAETRPEWVEGIVAFCVAIRDGHLETAHKFRDLDEREVFNGWLDKCCLLFGAERDLNLVKYILNFHESKRDRILEYPAWRGERISDAPSWRDDLARSPLLFAMESGNQEVVDYLLQDWIQRPLEQAPWDSCAFNTAFDGEKYFAEVLLSRPENFNSLSFDNQCVWYFCRRYLGAEFPEPGWIESSMAKLEADEQFLMRVVRLHDEDRVFNTLWELYGHDHALFIAMMDQKDVASANIFMPLRNSSQINQSKEKMLNMWLAHRNLKLSLTAKYLLMIQKDWDQFENTWEAAGGFKENIAQCNYPFLQGLKLVASELYKRVLRRETQSAIGFMLNLQSRSSDSRALSPSVCCDLERSAIYYLLAVAGSGKTHRIFNMLEHCFGFYFVSGASTAEGLTSDAGERLYHSRASAVSEDAELLLRTIENRKNVRKLTHLGRPGSNLRFEMRCQMLLNNRLALLFEVLQQSGSTPVQPWQWLRYQLAKNKDPHPLRKLLHCLMLVGFPDPLERDEAGAPRSRSPEGELKLLWCFDEVQCDTITVDQAAAWVSESMLPTTILSSLIYAFCALKGWHSGVLSGTALNCELVENNVGRGIFLNRLYSRQSDEVGIRSLDLCLPLCEKPDFEKLVCPCIRSALEVVWDATSPEHTGYGIDLARSKLALSLVGDETIFEDFDFLCRLRQRRREGLFNGLDEEQAVSTIISEFKSDAIWTQIKEQSEPLQGRYRWSACFIEELFKTLVMNRGLTAELVSQASEAVQEKAMQPLKRRILDLENSTNAQRRQSANDVFHMALQARLFGRSRILDSPNAVTLIEQALTYVEAVEEGKMKVSIAEQLVVAAVMEYLEEMKSSNSLTDQYLASWQYSASSFGFIAEDRLAEAIYIYASDKADLTMRRNFLWQFDNVHWISNASFKPSVQLYLGDFVLEQNPGPIAKALSGDEDLGRWLEQVFNNQRRPTFLLPSRYAGPDVMFVLRGPPGSKVERLICSVQSKVVKDLTIDDGVKNTLDPDQWYKSSQTRYDRRDFLDKFDTLKDKMTKRVDENFQFVSILLSACDKNVPVPKIVSELVKRKQDAGFAHDIVERAVKRERELRIKSKDPKRKSKPTANDLQKARRDVMDAVEVKKKIKSTDYYFKVIEPSSIEAIFGPTFYHYLVNIKDIES